MKRLARSAVSAFGLANLYLLLLTGPFLSPHHDLLFHLAGSAQPLFLAVIADLLLLTALLTGLLAFARRQELLEFATWSALLLALAYVLFKTAITLTEVMVPPWLMDSAGLVALLFFTLILAWRRSLLPWFQKLRPALTTVFGFVALSGVVMLAELIWFGWEARTLNPPPQLHHAQQTSTPLRDRPRIIWIVLDELSQQQVYERRFPGLKLPAFDQLASQATAFTQVTSTASYTAIALPSLITGMHLADTRATAAGQLLLLPASGTRRWQYLEPRETVFEDAIQAGVRTGVAGWYEPYCRMLPDVFDRCFWSYRTIAPGDMASNRSLAANIAAPLRELVLDIRHLAHLGPAPPSEGLIDVRRHTADYKALSLAGDDLLRDRSIGLVLLHIPVPHPWGFYDRATASFPDHPTSYIDNLALADLYLTHVQQLLQQGGQWDSSTVIVMGDHSWRTSLMWSKANFWSPEDRAASESGKYDPRPAFLVKLPNQHQPARIDASFDAVRTRSLIDALLRDRIKTTADLMSWLAEPGSSPPNTSSRLVTRP